MLAHTQTQAQELLPDVCRLNSGATPEACVQTFLFMRPHCGMDNELKLTFFRFECNVLVHLCVSEQA